MKINYSDFEVEDYKYENRNAKAPENVYDLAHHLSNNANGGYFKGTSSFRKGLTLGLYLRREHRTLQGNIINFLLGIICGLAEQKYTDARNETGVNTCKKVKENLENEVICLQPYI